jgi:hypothetical protein
MGVFLFGFFAFATIGARKKDALALKLVIVSLSKEAGI